MTFNEFAMLSPRKEQFHVEKYHSVREKVEFVPEASYTIEKNNFNKTNGGRSATS